MFTKLSIFFLLFASAVLAGMPQPRSLTVQINPYVVQPFTSNAVIVVYKSTSLGMVFTPPKPTSYFPATRTNTHISVVSGQLYHFYTTAQVQPLGESPPSNTTTNQVQ